MKTTAKKGGTKSAKTSTSRRAPRVAPKPSKNTTKPFAANASLQDELQSALKWLKSHSTKATLDAMARYALPSNNAFGVAYRDMKALGKRLGRNHELAAALWGTGVYEARMVTSFVADPALLTPAQMDRWCKDFDNWGIHLRHHVLQPVRPRATRLGQGHAMEQQQ